MIKALEFKKDPEMRKGAAQAPGDLESNAFVDPPTNSLEDDKEVKTYAVEALDQLLEIYRQRRK